MPSYEIIYSLKDLQKGKCKSCGEISDEILVGDGRCVECIEDQAFFRRVMKKESEDKEEF